jgi:aspartate ammonia-lyase
MATKKFRVEKDTLGTANVPREAYFGIQTVRAVENFLVSGLREDRAFIKAYGRIKLAACRVNHALGLLEDRMAGAIAEAAEEVINGEYDDQFVVDVFQAGAGTSFNMNMNEVIANRALEILGEMKGDYSLIHPNDHVNKGQSTNDTFPTAIHLATLDLGTELTPVLERLATAFEDKGRAFYSIIKSGRTHLQDAVPIRLGQEFLAYGRALRNSMDYLEFSLGRLAELPLGGTAVGTGLNAHPDYRPMVIEELRRITGFDVTETPDMREAMQSRQAAAAASAALKGLALELIRIANDLRLLSSGPATGLAEIILPAVQPGSSIMPAKVNPVMAECLNMLAFQIVGNDTAISLAVQAGQLELNVMMPLIAFNLSNSFRWLINYLPVFEEKCIRGIEANRERCENFAHSSAGLGTVLSPVLGYAKTAELIKESLQKQVPVRRLVVEKGLLSEEEARNLFAHEKLTGEK